MEQKMESTGNQTNQVTLNLSAENHECFNTLNEFWKKAKDLQTFYKNEIVPAVSVLSEHGSSIFSQEIEERMRTTAPEDNVEQYLESIILTASQCIGLVFASQHAAEFN